MMSVAVDATCLPALQRRSITLSSNLTTKPPARRPGLPLARESTSDLLDRVVLLARSAEDQAVSTGATRAHQSEEPPVRVNLRRTRSFKPLVTALVFGPVVTLLTKEAAVVQESSILYRCSTSTLIPPVVVPPICKT